MQWLPRRVLDVLSRDEIDRLEVAANAERDKVIVRLLADTGIRASELLGLRSGDVLEQGRDRFLRLLGASQGGGAKGRQGAARAAAAAALPEAPASCARQAGGRRG